MIFKAYSLSTKRKRNIAIGEIKILFSAIIIALALNACSPDRGDDVRHPLFIKAMNSKDSGDFSSAERFLNDYMIIKPLSPRGHIELAYLYHENLDDPFKAVYHYRRYLEISPESSDSEEIKSLISAAENKIRKNQQGGKSELERKFENEKNILLSQNETLKKEIAQLRKISGVQISAYDENKETPAPPTATQTPQQNTIRVDTKTSEIPESYVVEAGDNLNKISRKIYGNTKYYRLIFQANKDLIPNEDSPLQIGQKLIIPKLGQ